MAHNGSFAAGTPRGDGLSRREAVRTIGVGVGVLKHRELAGGMRRR